MKILQNANKKIKSENILPKWIGTQSKIKDISGQ